MFCSECGSRLEETTVVCPKCGNIVERNQYKKIVKKKDHNIIGIISLIFGIISILMCFNFMLKDISIVGMYTKMAERLYYALDLVLAPLFMAFITLIVVCADKSGSKYLNKISLLLSIVSLFFVVSEIVIVIIY